MDKKFVDGLKHGAGFMLVVITIFSVYAVGFHQTSEIVPGIFQGDYSFNGSVKVKESGIFKSSSWVAPSSQALVFMNDSITSHNGSRRKPLTLYSDGLHLKVAGNDDKDELTINTNGDVGIGTSNPNAMLDIHGQYTNGGKPHLTLSSPDTGDGSDSVINFKAGNDNVSQIHSYYYNSAGYGDGNMLFYTSHNTNGLTEKMRITNTGNVGIGTTNPQYALDVQGVGRINGKCFDSGRITGSIDTSTGWNYYDISFNVPFSSAPTVSVTPEMCNGCTGAGSIEYVGTRGGTVTSSGATIAIRDSSSTGLNAIQWIAIGEC